MTLQANHLQKLDYRVPKVSESSNIFKMDLTRKKWKLEYLLMLYGLSKW